MKCVNTHVFFRCARVFVWESLHIFFYFDWSSGYAKYAERALKFYKQALPPAEYIGRTKGMKQVLFESGL